MNLFRSSRQFHPFRSFSFPQSFHQAEGKNAVSSMSGNNVVVFGESGAGKSSTINLLLEREVAHISDSAVGCTFQFERYSGESYNLYDTVGLSEGSHGTIKSSAAINQLINLLKSLESGVSLLIFVMEKGRIKKTLDENYKLFAEAICQRQVPVILVITHCEMETERGQWWRENKHHFDNYGMKFKDVISGCSMSPGKAPPIMDKAAIRSLNEATISHLRRSIQVNMLVPGWRVKGGWRSWLHTILVPVVQIMSACFGPIGLIAGLLFGAVVGNGPTHELQGRIENYFLQQGYEPALAKQMASDIAKGI